MHLHRVSAVAALILGALSMTGCPASPPASGVNFELSVGSGSTYVQPGQTISIVVTANFIDGFKSTPVTGSAKLALASAGATSPLITPLTGGFPVTVPLTAGTGIATFTMCTEGPGCQLGDAVGITGTLVADGQTSTTTLFLTLGGPDAGPATSTDGGGSDGGGSGTTDAGPPMGAYAITLAVSNPNNPTTPLRIPAGGEAVEAIATVTQGGVAVPGLVVTFGATNDIGILSDPASPTRTSPTTLTATTDSSGNAVLLLTPESTGAAGGVLAAGFNTPSDGGLSMQVAAQQNLIIYAPASLSFTPAMTDAYNQVMGIRTSGYQETSTLRFTLLDSTGVPYIAPPNIPAVQVSFVIPALGGATVIPASVTLDGNGQAVTTVQSGVAVGTLAVQATAVIVLSPATAANADAGTEAGPGTTVTLTTTSATLTVVGAKANGRNFAISCDHYSVPALWGNDCTYMHVDVSPSCTAVIGDRFGNALGVATQVTWLSEAGLFGPPSQTTAAQPGVDPTSEPDLGRSSNTLRMLNAPLPEQNLAPIAGEPFQTPVNDCNKAGQDGGLRTYSPRDGLITFIASTRGEEGFVDTNGNGKWDPGEVFYDQGEPYVDSNDNNKWDPGEPFIDVNGNGQYDGPNGTWDSDSTIWTVGFMAVTGEPSSTTYNPAVLPDVNVGGAEFFQIDWQDDNLNEPSATFSTYGVGVVTPALGSVNQDSPATLVEKIGSMTITQPTVCGQSGLDAGVCEGQDGGAPTACDCALTTKIQFDGVRPEDVLYTAPAMGAGGEDTIRATVAEVVGTDTITTPWDAPIKIVGSTTTTPYVLAMTVQNSNGTPFGGKFYAGDPALNVVLTVTQGGVAPMTPQQVTLSVTNAIGILTDSSNAQNTGTSLTLTTDATGTAKATLVPATTVAGAGVMTALFGSGATTQTLQQNITVLLPGQLLFTPGTGFSELLGIVGSGYSDQTTATFTLNDSSGNPWAGLTPQTVKFTVPKLGGAFASPATTTLGSNGQVSTTVNSGVAAGTLNVTATVAILVAPADTVTLTATSTTIAVVGAKANGRNFSITCDHEAVPALFNNDCTYMHVDVSPTCTVVAGDRFGNALGVGTQVTWLSEAGLFGPPSQTTSAAPGVDPTSEPLLGRTSNSLRMLDAPLPEQNLTAMPGEPSQTLTNSCGTLTYSPRDGLVTLIAATQGEEGFTDVNENGQWDPGEPFVDEGEPYVDSNDNNVWDPGEPYVDVNGNGKYDGPNGVWDSETTIWTWSHIAVTGNPATSTKFNPSPFPSVAVGGTENFLVNWVDENLNEPAPLFTTYSLGLQVPALGAVLQTSNATYGDKPGSMTIDLPTTCAPSPVPGTCTVANPDCDCQLETSITFDGSRGAAGIYTAPAAGSGGTDVVLATAAAVVGTTTVSPEVTQAIKVTASTTSSPYTLTMNVQNSNGTAFAGKFYAGDPALNVIVTVTQGGQPPSAPQQVTLSATNGIGILTDASSAVNKGATIIVTTDVTGTARATMAPTSTAPGSGLLTGTFNGSTPPQTLQQAITVVTPGQLVFTPGTGFTALLGIAGSGYTGQTEIAFTLNDSSGAPWAGENTQTVSFAVPTLGGATVSPSPATMSSAGVATSTVYSGVAAGTLNVTATTHILIAPGDTVTLTATSSTIAVVGAKANGRNFSITCDHQSVPALWNNDCTYMHVDVSPTCTAVAGDRFGNALGVATQVTWLSEAGLFGPPSQTPAASPGVDPTSEGNLGRTTNSLRMLDAPLPEQNLKPLTGEPSKLITNSCGTATYSPRDGLITLIAATQGEEGFTDENENGQWDPGEPFFDQGEPYVDSNDNNQWDQGEPFIDVNGNGKYDGPNGIWDSSTTIWTVSHMAVTGSPIAGTTYTPSPFPSVAVGGTESFLVNWMDVNLNEPAALYTTYGLSVQAPALGAAVQTSPASLTDKPGSMTINLPTTCAPSPVNGTCTVANPNCDCQVETAINFDGPRSAEGLYNAPAAGNGGTDVVVATAAETVGTTTITPEVLQDIQITSSVTTSPYTLTMNVLNSNGTPFTGKFYAGDPALDVVLTVTQSGGAAPATPQQVTLGVTAAIGSLTDASNALNKGTTIIVTTNAAGTARATLTPVSTAPGSGVLTATFNGSTPAQTLLQDVTVVTPGQLVFTPGTGFSGLLGIAGSGYTSQTEVSFTLNDSSGAPWAGLNPQTVSFSVPSLGGATVSPSPATMSSAGLATSTVYSGVAAGTLNVTATTHILIATGVTVTLSGTSTTIAVVGAKANGKNFSITCDHDAVPALWNNDCSFMHVNISPTCTAVAGDRFGNALGVATQVIWLSEAGLFGPPSQTTAATPGTDPTSEPTLGQTSNSLRMLDAPLPEQNLTPFTGEPSQTVTNSCGTLKYSPRDGLITLIAATQGEEGFTDLNENGQWDPGEPFIDEGEPFVDSNDNNTWDPGEPYVDVNGNGKYDGPNGTWDSSTTIWTASHIAVTGNPAASTTFTPSPFTNVALGGVESFLVNWMDVNLNEPAPLFTSYATTLQAPAIGTVLQTSAASLTDKWGSMTVTQPTTCAPSPVNGTCTVANPDCDCQITTALTFDGPRSATGIYDAPVSGAGGTDVVVATAAETVGGTALTTQVTQGIKVTTTQGSTPYTLAMNVYNSNGTVFAGKFYAGDPALTVVATVTQGGAAPATPQQVTLSVTNSIGVITDSTNAMNKGTTIVLTTNAAGTAMATLAPESTIANAGVLSSTFNAGTVPQTLQQVVTVVTPTQLVFAPTASFTALLGIEGSGYTGQTPVTFTLNDSSGAPWAGETAVTVNFTVTTLGGATVTPGTVTLNSSGQATANVFSGVSAGTMVATASASLLIAVGDTVTLTAQSSTIAVVGAKANGKNFSITCDHEAVPTLWNNDCTYMHVDVTPTCTAVLGDRFGNALGVATQVTWLSEAGLFGPPSQTPAATPGVNPTSEPTLGQTQNSLHMLNATLPEQNLTPLAGEMSYTATNACGTNKYSPRDGLITLIAATQGEEGFIDANGNGKWDKGELFFDQGEPYVDENDNNQYDVGEPYIDVNGNGSYDGPNGTWDSNTTIWQWAHIVATGNPAPTSTFTPDPFTSVVVGSSEQFIVTWQDENLNEPAPLFTTYALGLTGSSIGTVAETSPAALTDKWGSMTINQPTVCVANASACTVASPNCDCQLQTAITFDGPRTTTGVYIAPVSGNAGSATIIATAAETVGTTSITPQIEQSISVTATQSQNTSPYAVTITLENGSGVVNATGKYSAGDPAMTVLATLTQGGGIPPTSQPVVLSVTNSIGTLTDASNAANTGTTITVMTNAFGVATATLTPESTAANQGLLTATYNDVATGGQVIVQQLITVVIPASLTFTPGANFTQLMGVAGSGYNTESYADFTLLDSSGSPWTSVNPVTVSFSVPNVGGSYVSPTSITLDQTGQASTVVYSGVAAGTLAVTASTTVTLSTIPLHTVSLSVTSSTIAIVGAKANGRNFSLNCGPEALPALWGNDCSFMHADQTATCTVVIGDRYGNTLGVATQVSWLTEAGLFGPPSSTTAATPGADPTSEPNLGRTSNTLRTYNSVLPEQNLTPFAGEPNRMHNNDGCGLMNHSPRDGLITLIAATQGEEGFTDENANGQWDPGEPFFDQGEPYVDSNDNNQWDVGEPFIDVNGNNVYDGPNGQWDANTTVWTVGHVAVTNEPGDLSSFASTGSTSLGGSLDFTATFEDENYNETAPTFSTYGVGVFPVALGTATLLAPSTGTFTDRWGSMDIKYLTSCGPSAIGGVCSVANPNCDCELKTSISFPGARSVVGVYAAPASCPATAPSMSYLTDTVFSGDTERIGSGTVVDEVAGTITSGPCQ